MIDAAQASPGTVPRMKRDRATAAFLLALRIAVWASVAAVFAVLLKWAGPDAEVTFSPIIVRQGIGPDVERREAGAVACWTHHYDKVRPAEVTDAGWTIRARGEIYPFQRLRRDDRSRPGFDGVETRPVGVGQATRRCADVPDSLVNAPLRITGFVEYRTPWTGWLWTVRQETPEVDVP